MRRNKQEVTEMYRQMCGLRRQGESRAEIAGAFGCSVSTVDRAIRLCGEKEIMQDSFEKHREQSEPEEHLEVRQYAVHIRRATKIRVRVGRQWKTMQDVSDWWL